MASLTLSCRSVLLMMHPSTSSVPALHAREPSQMPDIRQRTDSSRASLLAPSAALPFCFLACKAFTPLESVPKRRESQAKRPAHRRWTQMWLQFGRAASCSTAPNMYSASVLQVALELCRSLFHWQPCSRHKMLKVMG